MVESSIGICEADERHALIIGISPGLPTVREDVRAVEAFTARNRFNSVTVLRDDQATTDAVVGFFTEQGTRCYQHGKRNNSNKKYLLMVFYAGHGNHAYGTQHVSLHDND